MIRVRDISRAPWGVVTRPSAPATSSPGARVLSLPWVMVVVGVWVGSARAQPTKSTLWEHFFVDECSLIPSGNLTRMLPLKSLAEDGGFLLELGIYGPYNPRLEAGLHTCTLPSTSLFHATPKGKHTKKITLTFTKVLEEDEGTEDDGMMKEDEEEDNEGISAGEDETVCNLPLSDSVSLLSGYGFVSCRGPEDRAATVTSLRAWRKEVQQVEAEASAAKTKIIGGVVGGMALMLLGCIVYVVARQRSSRRPFRPDRRPSQQSVRTHLTMDSTSQPTRNKSSN